MASRTRSSSRSNKGQFFIVSAATIVVILFFVGRWLEPSRVPDTSTVAMTDELFTFDNIREKAGVVVEGSESCDDLSYSLAEYRDFVLDFARDKNYRATFDYSLAPCSEELGTIVEFNLRVTTDKADAEGTFFLGWP